MLLLRTAWRNLWRNRRRTGIALASLVACSATMVMITALMDGLFADALHNATALTMGEVQVHQATYRKRRGFYDTLRDPDRVLSAARRAGADGVQRAFGAGLVGHDNHSAAAELWGVSPGDEARVFSLHERLDRGQWLGPPGGAVLGSKLARTLDVTLGSELVVVVQAADGSIGNELYTVRGILGSVGERLDRGLLILPKADFETLFAAEGFVHEIAVTTGGARDPRALARTLRKVTDDEVVPWQTLQPVTAEMMNMSGSYTAVFVLIFYLAAGLGILNTMLMAAHERVRELGLERALGASPWHVAGGLLLEVSMLGLLGAALGGVFGVAGALYLQTHGIDTRLWVDTALESGGMVFDPVWRARLHWRSAVTTPLALWPTSLLAAAYPAWVAARVRPVVAMGRV